MKYRYNIVVLGKTGTGKSTLINYLLEKRVAETGAGKPVTGKGFYPYDFSIKDFPVSIFDSSGLETGKSDIWLTELQEELDRRSPKRPPEEWFHTVYYCIDSGGARIEDFEINIINKLLENNYRVFIILTKSDLAGEEEINTLVSVIRKSVKSDISIIPVCSEEKILTGGLKTKTFGRDEIKLSSYNNFWDSIFRRVPDRCIALIKHKVKIWETEQCIYAGENAGNFNSETVYESLVKRGEDFLEEFKNEIIPETIKEELKNTFHIYEEISINRDYEAEKIILEEIIDPSCLLSDNYQGWTNFLKSLPFIVVSTPFIFGIVTLAQVLTTPLSWFLGESPINCYEGLTDTYHFQKYNNIEKFCKNLTHFSDELCNSLDKMKPEIEILIKDIAGKVIKTKFSMKEKEICYDFPEEETGDLLWTFKTGGAIISSPLAVDGYLYFGSQDGNFYCLDGKSGKVKWKFGSDQFLESITCSPCAHDGFLYFGNDCGNFFCLDTVTGKKIWEFQSDLGVISAPYITEKYIYLNCTRGKIYCLDLRRGTLIWSYKTEGLALKSGLFISDGLLYCGSSGRFKWTELFYCLDAERGIVKWTFETENNINSSPIAEDGRVYFGCSDYNFYCLDAYTGEKLWSFITEDSINSSPALDGMEVYFGCDDKNLYCLNSYTGELIWSFKTKGPVISSPCIAGDFICFGSFDGEVYFLRKEDGSKVKTFKTQGTISSSPCIEDGLLFTGSDDGNLYCFDTGERGIAGSNVFNRRYCSEKYSVVL